MDNVLACITFFIFLIVCIYCYLTSLFRRQSSHSWNLCKYNSEIEVVGKHNNQMAKTSSEISLINQRTIGKTSEYKRILKNARLRAEVEYLKGEQNSLIKKCQNNFYKPADITFSQWASDIMQQQHHLLQEPNPNSALKTSHFQGDYNWQQRAKNLANHIRECEIAAKAHRGEERQREEKKNVDLLVRNHKIEESNKILELRIHLMKTERCLEESQEELNEVENEVQSLHEQVDSATLENKILQEQVDMLKQEIVLLNAHLDSVMKERDSYEKLAISERALWKTQLPRIKYSYSQERSAIIGLSSLTDEETEKQKEVLKSLKGPEFQNSVNENKQRQTTSFVPTREADKEGNLIVLEKDIRIRKYSKSENSEAKPLIDYRSKNLGSPESTNKDEIKKNQRLDEHTDSLEEEIKEKIAQKYIHENVSNATIKLVKRKCKNAVGYKTNSEYKHMGDKSLDLQQPLKRTKWTNSIPIVAQTQLNNIPERDGEFISRICNKVQNIGTKNIAQHGNSLDDASSSVKSNTTCLKGRSGNENKHTSDTPGGKECVRSESTKQQEEDRPQISVSSFNEDKKEDLEHLRFSDEDDEGWNSEADHDDDETLGVEENRNEDFEDKGDVILEDDTIVPHSGKPDRSPREENATCFKTGGSMRPISDSMAFKNFLKSIETE